MTTVCDRCGTTFDVAPERCPKCLRKSSLRTVTASEVSRLASGDQSPTAAAFRMSALLTAAALIVALVIVVLAAWRALDALGIETPAVVAATVAAAALVRGALRAPGWGPFARDALRGVGLGAWTLVSGTIGLATTAGLSIAMSLGVWAVTFLGGVIAYLQWLKSKETPETPAGKHR